MRSARQKPFDISMRMKNLSVILFSALLATTADSPRAQPSGYAAVVETSPRMRSGEEIVLANVHAGQPIVVWPSGSAEPTTRAFQDSEHVVLVFVAKLSGGTETFYLNTKSMRFTLVEATLPAATEPGFRPAVTFGTLRRK